MTKCFWRAGALLGGCLMLVVPAPVGAASPGLLPDIRTVVPKQLQLVNPGQREVLRFSNGIANTGAGHWRMRPEVVGSGTLASQNAIQEILDADGNVVDERLVSTFEFHPEHDHWHIDRVALFEIRSGSPTGPIVGGNTVKVTFCRIWTSPGSTRASTTWSACPTPTATSWKPISPTTRRGPASASPVTAGATPSWR